MRPAANTRFRAVSTSACRVADTPACQKDYPVGPSFFPPCSPWPPAVTLPTGEPAPAVGHSGANSGHGPPFAPLRPPLSRAGLESNCLPGSSHFGPGGASSNGKRFSASPGPYWLSARRPRSLPAKGTLQRHFLEGTRPLRGVPSGGLLAVRQTPPSNSIPSVFLPRASLEARPSEPVALLPEFLVATGRHASTGGPVRPAANARCRAVGTSACRVADPLVYRRNHAVLLILPAVC